MKRTLLKIVFTLFMPLLYVILIVDTLLLGGTTILVSFFDRDGNRVHYLGKLWSRMNLFLSGVRVRVGGLERLRKGQPYIVMSNHQSLYDVWAIIGYIPLQLRWVMKKELRKVPIFGYACARMGHIYVDRGDSEKARRSLEAAGKKIRSGSSVIFFPEGTRSLDGKLLPFKKGGFVVALAAGVPILAMTINGSRAVLPKGSARSMPGVIDITIHEPIAVDGYVYETKEQLVDKIRQVIEGGLRP
jgi:1-acyl-sn-glycerol-3-phosphate acyltransferase